SRVRMPRRRPRGEGGPPRRPRPPIRPPQGVTPLLRLVGLIAFAILIVVLLVFWVQSCQSNAKKNSYRHYMENVSQVAQSSKSVGADLATALTTPGEKKADLVQTLGSLAQREQQDVAKAQGLHPPGPLRDEHAAVVQALQFRVSGLQGLAATLRASQGTKTQTADASLLGEQSQRFVASDVIWSDLFQDPAKAELPKQGITGVAVPGSVFLSDPTLVTSDTWTRILQRLAGASTGGKAGGLHGTALEYVKAVPSGTTLSSSSLNTITETTDLGFQVGVKDTGNAQEVGIDVTLTIEQNPPVVKTQRIQVIDPNEVKNVVFKNLGQLTFAQKVTLKVDIAPVPNEANSKNNSASYQVIFSVG
ncbi:MAG TPA: hypothetical protein VLN26_00790, partial [Gaiellaceae bacterium]|nr:hypothetical protein [Gaiellaceae bacterium]